MVRKLTTEEFINKAKAVHGDRFDYSLTIYKDIRSKVNIICEKHGEFFQKASNHLNGSGCRKCANDQVRLSFDDFVLKANKIHNGAYKYNRNKYYSSNEKTEIICNIHGSFLMSACNHLTGQGCKKCSFISKSNKKRRNEKDVIKELKKIHNNLYDYSKVVYKGRKNKIEVICKKHGSFFVTVGNHLKGSRCPKCKVNIGKKYVSFEEFVSKANITHNNKYLYSRFKNFTLNKPVIIYCLQHGMFFQIANNHLNMKHACPDCYPQNNKKINKKEFIKRATEKYGNEFNYSNLEYIDYYTKITFACNKHGIFTMSPMRHINNKYGCPFCAQENVSKLRSLSREDFIKRAIKIHGNNYDYSKVNYVNARNLVTIICNKHGEFQQLPYSHLSGGCIQCGYESHYSKMALTRDDFIKKATKIHKNRYNYSKVVYKSANNKVKIICDKHGIFLQSPGGHMGGNGCPRCAHVVSKGETKWLDKLGVPKDKRNIVLKVNGKKFSIDGFDSHTNTIYEFNGDFWHGNPEFYDPNDINPISKKKFGYLYNRTIEKETTLKAAGYDVISIWESDFIEC